VAESEYVQVAFPIPVSDTFTYIVPEPLRGKVVPGSHVTAFLGRRKLSGFVVSTEPRKDLKNVRPLESLVRPAPVLDRAMLELTKNVADYYLCPWGQVLAAAYPGHAEKSPRVRSGEERGLGGSDKTKLEAAFGTDLGDKSEIGPVAGGVGQRSSRNGSIRDSLAGSDSSAQELSGDHYLESDLSRYLAPLVDASNQGKHRIFLLSLPDHHRERMYPFLVTQITRKGGSVLFLVPEVSTSSSLVELLKEHFDGEMALFHSRLRISERKAIWEKSRSGKLKLLIGTRSTVFLPAQALRLIVVEDEHAEPFKQEETPRYDARNVAIMRSRLAGTPLLLASATPSVESVWAARRGEFEFLEGTPLEMAKPRVNVVDMRKKENVIPHSEELSVPLISAIEKTLDVGKKVLLFLNRRGFYTWVQCQECGFLEVCPRCELPLIYHSESKSLVCHHCAHKIEAPVSCRKCGGTRFRYGGAGGEKVQTRLKRFFPRARVARIDFDSARTRPDAVQIAGSFARGDVDILIGTLMLTKGLELGEFSLAGVIHAEARLNLPDFRSGERAFQLLSDVVSLVRDPCGEVIVQTLNPEHHSIAAISQSKPGLFYEQELEERRDLGYPPFSTLISFHVIGTREAQVVKVVRQMGTCAVSVSEKSSGALQILGPSPGIPTKLKGRFRWYMSIRGAARDEVSEAARKILSQFGGKHEISGATLSVDVDPVSI
jgi:primosomal protein N' (replication factor Y) (superfamily II helicase)